MKLAQQSMTGHAAVAHIGKKACDGRVGLAAVVGDLPVIPVLPSFAQGFLDLWNVEWQTCSACKTQSESVT